MKVCFFLHSNVRSGGNLILLRHAAYLGGQGHRVCVVFWDRVLPKTIDFVGGAEAVDTCFLDEYIPRGEFELQDVVITNWWQCAYELQCIPARRYSFYRHGDTKALYHDRVFDALIDAIFREDLLWFCVSDFLATELVEAGHRPILLPNGVDFAHFSTAAPSLPQKSGPLRVLVEGSVSVNFKRIDATVAAIRGLTGVEIVHMAADGSLPAAQVDYALGAVDHHATAGVYASCDLIVKLSRAPESFAIPVLEQFAAGGTAVVTGFTGHEQYIDASNAIVVEVDRPFEAAAAAVTALRDDPQRLQMLRGTASATARRFDWQPLHRKFAAALEHAVRDQPETPQPLPIIERYIACHRETFILWGAKYEWGRKSQWPEQNLTATDSATTGAL